MNTPLQVFTEKTKHKSFKVNRFDESTMCPHVQLHLHTDYEIVYLKKGSGRIRVDNYETTYEDGALVFIGSYIPHYGLLNKEYNDNFEFIIHFDEYFVNNQLQLFPEFDNIINLIRATNNVLVFDLKTKKELGATFEKMVNQNDLEQLASLIQIFSKMSNSTNYANLLPEKYKVSNEYFERFKQIQEYINTNFQNNISTKDIASHFYLTTNSFCRFFKKIHPKPFMQYLNEFRINNAVYLLESTNQNISEIMYASGFTNFSYFIKQFRKIKSQSPSSYRNNFNLKMKE